jgi:alpha-tubulin suppressor-like RCC1 family protein
MARNFVVKTVSYSQDLQVPAGTKSVIVRAIQNRPRALLGGTAGPHLNNSGQIWNWGRAGAQAGDNTTIIKSSPVLVVGGLTAIHAVVGSSALALLTEQGQVFSWGSNLQGILGDNTVTDRASPVLAVGGLTFQKLLAPGRAITSSGDLYVWGTNSGGELGDNTFIPKSSPVLIAGGLTWSYVFSGVAQLGIDTDGRLYSWGSSTDTQLGRPAVATNSPVEILPGVKVVDARVNANGGIALGQNGDVYCWGRNAHGQLGDGTINQSVSPVQVLGGLKFVSVSGGGTSIGSRNTTYGGLTASGDVYTWGNNINGQLGIGVLGSVSSPTLVVGGLKFTQLEQNLDNGYALTDTYDMYSWGANSDGRLGDGTTTTKSSPVAVVGGIKFAQIASSRGIDFQGGSWGWGGNTTGFVGDGTNTARSSPVLLAGTQRFAVESARLRTTTVVPVDFTNTLRVRFSGPYAFVNSVCVASNFVADLQIEYFA